ncbi:MAG TPA: HD domain-containing phosphohydrolase [Thermoleophilaceae bacterium]|nr:HD domain-containing phosphohydrolase [Thermoleophilaceae bacterium]
MASRVARPPDQFPVAELRAAARAAGEAVDDGDYLQSAVAQLSELVGSERCSLLVLRQGSLYHGGSVGLPSTFMAAIDGTEIGPHVGTCGAAASRARAIVTPDIHTDPKWEPFLALAEDAGLRSCWSVPLRLSGGPVLGTFAAYDAEPGTPDPGQVELAEAHASLVALGLDRLRREERLSESYEAVVVALSSALDVRDEYTGAHSTETARMAVEVGRRMGLCKPELQRLEQAAMLHDIGKLGIPTEILHAPRALTEEERKVVERHPVIGEQILKDIPFLGEVARAVRHEHERWDGGGYPDGLAGEAIPLASRVVFACDAWHAMTSDRPYRKALDEDVARAELAANAGTQFDPRAVQAVLEVVGERRGLTPPAAFDTSHAVPDPDTEEQRRGQLLASVAEQTGADDLFVFRLTSAGRFSHVDGTGRGAGWAGNVEVDAEHEPAFAHAVEAGEPVCLSHPDRGRVFGPYYAKTAALVPHGPEVVVVLGSAGDELAGLCSQDLVKQTERAAGATRAVPPAKQLADELEVLEAVRAITAITSESVEDALSQVGEIAARSLSCEYGGAFVVDGAGEMRVGEARLGWGLAAGHTVESVAPVALPELEFPLLVQDVSAHPFLGELPALAGATSVHAVELGSPALGVLFVIHADSTPRGFTLLCRRLTRSVADAAEIVLRRALAAERVAESRS